MNSLINIVSMHKDYLCGSHAMLLKVVGILVMIGNDQKIGVSVLIYFYVYLFSSFFFLYFFPNRVTSVLIA